MSVESGGGDQQLINAVLLTDDKDADEESSDDGDGQEKKCGWKEADQSFLRLIIKFMERNEAYLENSGQFQKCRCKAIFQSAI